MKKMPRGRLEYSFLEEGTLYLFKPQNPLTYFDIVYPRLEVCYGFFAP